MAQSYSAEEEHELSDAFTGVAPEGGCAGCGPETCCGCRALDREPDESDEISQWAALGLHYACKTCYLEAFGG